MRNQLFFDFFDFSHVGLSKPPQRMHISAIAQKQAKSGPIRNFRFFSQKESTNSPLKVTSYPRSVFAIEKYTRPARLTEQKVVISKNRCLSIFLNSLAVCESPAHPLCPAMRESPYPLQCPAITHARPPHATQLPSVKTLHRN